VLDQNIVTKNSWAEYHFPNVSPVLSRTINKDLGELRADESYHYSGL
jgi:hypothetical protein